MKPDYSHVFNAHPAYIESLYKQYQQDPTSIDQAWRTFFSGYDFASDKGYTNGHSNGNGTAVATAPQTAVSGAVLQKEFGVHSLIHGYRDRGHLLSNTNPIKPRKDRQPRLDLGHYGLSESDLDTRFQAGKEINLPNATLREIVDKLKAIYCGTIGFEFAHIERTPMRQWLGQRIESRNTQPGYGLSLEKKRRILEKLNGAVIFERFLHTKYIGQKRFSLEGGETTIAALDAAITLGGQMGVKEVVIGMAHRGRLNVLANIMGKTYDQIFNEFEGNMPIDLSFGSGDVKYHLGYSSLTKTPAGDELYLKLAPNPSHLEAVDPVVEGFSRAKADLLYGSEYDRVLPVLIHGDAAVAGQGVVYETAQMSQLEGYYTGGTLHFVINNQVGFTTDFDDARSSIYCTGAGNMIQAPIFHVNGDDPEAVIFATELALEFRQEFHTDVFIDMVCYRRHGHNESDDPQFTQPSMYKIIKDHPDPRELYVRTLVSRADIEAKLAEELENSFWAQLQDRLDKVKQSQLPYVYQEPEEVWRSFRKKTTYEDYQQSVPTGVDKKQLQTILDALVKVPDSIKPTPKVTRLLAGLEKKIQDNELDWGTAELMAYGTLLLEGKDVRMSGQDVKRGTFSHRHAVFFDVENGAQYNRLSQLKDQQGKFRIFNSLLSEYAVLGFEYGYSMAAPQTLVIWEAQFGDFSNGAATIVDQFIASGESKWSRMSGLVMLLPHGFEGQGPEHSSARLERYLQLCAENNMTVANITTPANFFHALRRQLVRDFRKPFIHMSPKSLLRHPLCVSKLSDFEPGTKFQEVLDDPAVKAPSVKKVLFCSGKVYYDLLAYQTEQKRQDVALVRIEQLYPFPTDQIKAILAKYKKAEYSWVQEEPANAGAWSYIRTFCPELPVTRCISRPWSASPAVGSAKIHEVQTQQLVKEAFS